MKFESRQICSSKYDIDTSASGLSINIKVLKIAWGSWLWSDMQANFMSPFFTKAEI